MLDELPLWSAPFGLELLNMIELRKNLKVLDIGFGTGFPLIEIAQRLGKSSKVYGIDPWKPSHIRAKQKIDFYGIKNIKLIMGEAEDIPLKRNTIDLIVSNNGINNVYDIEKVFKECNRISKKGAMFIISLNLNNTFKEFYDIFRNTLNNFDKSKELENLNKHIYEKRKPVANYIRYFSQNSFQIEHMHRKMFKMRFTDEEAFFNHTLIKIGFLPSWERLIEPKDQKKVFFEVKQSLRDKANTLGYLEMTVPYIIISAKKK